MSNTPGFTSVDPFSQIELPSVHSFSISNRNANPRLDDARGVRSLSSGDFIGVIKAIRLPNLRLLFISHTSFEYSLSLEQWLLDAFPPSHVSDALEYLQFEIQQSDYEYGFERATIHVDEIFKRFTSLQALHLDTGKCDVAFNPRSQSQPNICRNLSSIDIKFDGGDRSQLYDLLGFMRFNKAPLKRINIESTYRLDWEKIKELFPTGRVNLSMY